MRMHHKLYSAAPSCLVHADGLSNTSTTKSRVVRSITTRHRWRSILLAADQKAGIDDERLRGFPCSAQESCHGLAVVRLVGIHDGSGTAYIVFTVGNVSIVLCGGMAGSSVRRAPVRRGGGGL